MAKKLGKSDQAKTTSAPANAGADDLAVMHPDQPLCIAGRSITIREYGHIEGLRVRAYMRPFTKELEELFAQQGEGLIEDIIDLISAHIDIVHRAIAQAIAAQGEMACDADIDWIASLSGQDGEKLLYEWWGVCGLFFVGQILRRVAERARRAQEMAEAKARAGSKSTTPSSTEGTANPNALADIPSDRSASTTAR